MLSLLSKSTGVSFTSDPKPPPRRMTPKNPHHWRRGPDARDIPTSVWSPYDPSLEQPSLAQLNPMRNPYHNVTLKGRLYDIKYRMNSGRVLNRSGGDDKARVYDYFNPIKLPKYHRGHETDDETMAFFVALYEEAILAATHGVPHLLIETRRARRSPKINKQVIHSVSVEHTDSLVPTLLSDSSEEAETESQSTIKSIASTKYPRTPPSSNHKTTSPTSSSWRSDWERQVSKEMKVRMYEELRIRAKAHIETVVIIEEAIAKATEALKTPSPTQKIVEKLTSSKSRSRSITPPVDSLHWVMPGHDQVVAQSVPQ